ncbi:MAG: EAL domain-containing protein [bacterium]|nr:EAL domain-containing protein [bacterium]
MALLRDAGIAYEHTGELVSLELADASLREVLERIEVGLTSAECDAARAVLLDAGETPSLSDYLRADALTRVISMVRSRWLLDALGEQTPVSFFQPIFDVATGAIFAREALLRVERDGAYVGPGEAFRAASDHDMTQYLDRVARETAIASAARGGVRENIFVNFLPSAIYDPRTCLATTVRALAEHNIASDRIVFEVVESDRIHDPNHLSRIIDSYRAQGFRVALDDLGAGYSSFTLLNHLRPDFVKLDMELIRDVDRDPFKSVLASKLIDAATDLGIAIIAEGIEREEELAWVRERKVGYVQGYLLGRPELLAG